MRTHIILYLILVHLGLLYGQNISIVGAGIGGASCAWYLNKFDNITGVNVFESRDYIGGRIKEVMFGGYIMELGAEAWSSVNFYIRNIVWELNIEIRQSSPQNITVMIWDEDEFVNWELIALMNKDTDICFLSQINDFVDKIYLNYVERELHSPFTSINEFLSYGGFTNFTLKTFNDYLDKCNASEKYKRILISPYTRAVYDQALNLQSFAGDVVFVNMLVPTHMAKYGNSQIPKEMFKHAQSNIHLNTSVEIIEWTGENYIILANGQKYISDYVIIASPIEKTNIQFINVEFYTNITYREFVAFYVFYVEAENINPTYFGLTSNNTIPNTIFTTSNSTLPFTFLGYQGTSLKGHNMYSIFSNTDISDLFNDIFINLYNYTMQDWPYTFPKLIPTNQFQPIILAKNLYYCNTIESTASAMEMSVIAGRNIAQLLISSFDT